MKRTSLASIVACLLYGVAPVALRAQASGAGALQQITAEPGLDIDAVYSVDGLHILYSSSRSGSLELWMRPVAGGALYQITSTTNGSVDRNPSFTSDGATVVFQSDRVTGVRNIWAITLANRSLAQLTNVPDGASNPAVSPAGDLVCYTRSTENGRITIWVMGIGGQQPRELGVGLDCAWTPDGRRIVFGRDISTRSDQPQYDIWIMDVDGQNARQVVETANAWERSPAVSPDGQWVVYSRYPRPFTSDIEEVPGGFQVRPGLQAGIWLAPLDGSVAPREVTDAAAFNSYAAWVPDGSRIVFTSTRSGSADLWGAGMTTLARKP